MRAMKAIALLAYRSSVAWAIYRDMKDRVKGR